MAQRSEPMYLKIYNDLYNKIQEKEYTDSLPTELELSEMYGVSRITVQKAMKMLADANIIRRIAGRGSFVSSTKELNGTGGKLIGVIFCNIAFSFGMDILVTMEQIASKKGYSLVFKNSQGNAVLENRILEDLIDIGVEGIVIQPVHGENFSEKIMELSLRKFPLVVMDRNLAGLDLSFVGTDNKSAVLNMMEYLFGCGHSNIAFFAPQIQNTTTIEERIDAFKLAYLKENKYYSDEYLYTDIHCTTQFPLDEMLKQRDIENLKGYFLKNPQITCVFCAEHAIAQLTREALEALGKTVPEDISVVCFDVETNGFRNSQFTHIKQNQEKIAEVAVETIDRLIQEKGTNCKIYLEAELVERTSVKCVP